MLSVLGIPRLIKYTIARFGTIPELEQLTKAESITPGIERKVGTLKWGRREYVLDVRTTPRGYPMGSGQEAHLRKGGPERVIIRSLNVRGQIKTTADYFISGENPIKIADSSLELTELARYFNNTRNIGIHPFPRQSRSTLKHLLSYLE